MLWARGAKADVIQYLRRASAAIRDLPLQRLDDERRILLTESAGRQRGFVDRLLGLRFGGHGYGIVGYEELGLDWLDGELVQRWANERFCAENAVCLLTTRPPPDLGIELPSGTQAQPPPLDPLPELNLPAHIADGTGGVALTVVAGRSWATVAGLGIAARNLNDELRVERAITYGVTPGYLRLGAESSHLTISADCLNQYAGAIQNRLVEEIEQLAASGPSNQALEDWHRGWEDMTVTPEDIARGEVDRVATEALLGREPLSFEQLAAARKSLTKEEIASALGDAITSALLVVPAGSISAPKSFHPFQLEVPQVPQGKTFRFQGLSANRAMLRRKLIVGTDRLCLVPASGEQITIPIADCIGVQRSSTGELMFFARNGSWFRLDPSKLRNSPDAISAIRATVPAGRFFPPYP
jgi:hypothetical protein